MAKSWHSTAGLDPVYISLSRFGPSQGILGCSPARAGREGEQRDSSREGVEGGGLQLRVETVAWGRFGTAVRQPGKRGS